jgi:hypothetical protein
MVFPDHMAVEQNATCDENSKIKVKLSMCLTEHHAMKAYWGSGGIAPCIV